MNFRPELAEAVMAGRKTVTRRLVSDNQRSPWWRGKCSLKVGRDYAVCPGRGKHAIGRARVLRVSREPLHLVLNHGEAHREGFPNAPAFREAWKAINGGWDDMALVWRVEFVALCHCGHRLDFHDSIGCSDCACRVVEPNEGWANAA